MTTPQEAQAVAQWLRASFIGNAIEEAANMLTEYAAMLERQTAGMLDCRTCRHHTTATGGCVSVLACREGSAYQRAGVRQCWNEA